jgi:rhodanese-related sulfurtransferase
MNPMGVPTTGVDQVDSATLLLDVREDQEWAAGHIEAAIHIAMSQIATTLAQTPTALPADQPIVVVCAVGARSAQVTAWLNQLGYQASNLTGGMHAWADAGRAMISDTGRPATVL